LEVGNFTSGCPVPVSGCRYRFLWPSSMPSSTGRRHHSPLSNLWRAISGNGRHDVLEGRDRPYCETEKPKIDASGVRREAFQKRPLLLARTAGKELEVAG
jgi:hypothetical protein